MYWLNRGVWAMKECKLYECYEPVLEGSRSCQYHQPVKEDKGACCVCGSVVDFEEEGGHIYTDGSVTCPTCEEEGK